MKIVVTETTYRKLSKHATYGRMTGTEVPGLGFILDVDRQVIARLFDRVPIGDSWDEAIGLLLVEVAHPDADVK